MPRAALALLVATFASSGAARAQGACSSDSQCSPYEVCTTSVGECSSGPGDLDVCTGTCQPGRRFRFVPSVGGLAAAATDNVTVGFALAGLEVIPPILWGRLSASAELWSPGLIRLGLGSPWPLHAGFLLTPRVDGLLQTGGSLNGTASLRLDYFPYVPFNGFTPAHYFSLAVEGGTTLMPLRSPFLGASVRLWL